MMCLGYGVSSLHTAAGKVMRRLPHNCAAHLPVPVDHFALPYWSSVVSLYSPQAILTACLRAR